ncbi:MAG: hypothetical protein US96_C0003G0021 [Candidatus Woesebacteria bacterium GW2011_GWB1_38_5b]|uniref:TrpR like protein, YerC/YecD n=1 Tax=Candidatus Woesebacteria bacterium GW2011_GWB1_38_5b TaxID=1618569 RepID=A0A0G0K868_9BACT|nr:MAG: hypothetical protein US96_C0003G0021 [Candidatus Woesebacteria bacterium GW2011_GWB1_38_5b]
MTQISRHRLTQDRSNRIEDLFIETLANLKNKDVLKNFVNDFFSPTEKIVFSKRLACAVLLYKGHDYQSISDLLHITPNTIAKINLRIQYGGSGLTEVVKLVVNSQAKQVFLEEIKDMLDLQTKGTNFARRAERQRGRKVKIQKLTSEF